MTKVIVDERLRRKLINLAEQAELCDELGQTFGTFIPREPQETKLPPGVEPPFSQEELERRMNEPGGRTLAEIWADLEKS